MDTEKSPEEASHTTFTKFSTKDESQNPANFYEKANSNDFEMMDNKNLRKTPARVIHGSITNPLAYQNLAPSYFSDNDVEEFSGQLNECPNANMKSISCSNIHFSEQWRKDNDTECKDSHSSMRRRYSSLVAPTNTKNKMSLQKTRPMSFGGKFGQSNFQKVDIYGKQIQVGLGFPTKTPIIKSKTTEIIENSDKYFDNLENLIQNIKNNKNPSEYSFEHEEGMNSAKVNNFNIGLSAKDIFDDTNDAYSQDANDFDSTKNKYIEMETNLLIEFTDIKTSINKILEDRKQLQSQHRIWLQKMKTKIYQTKERARSIEIIHQT